METRAPDTQPTHPPPFIHYPTPPHTHKTTLILLHGTSQTGPELASTLLSFPVHSQTLPSLLPNTKLLFPTGSPKPTTVFSGKETHAWFDIHTFSDRTVGESDQLPGLRESVVYLAGLVREEVEGFVERGLERREAGRRVVVMGFSLGCAVGVVGVLSGEVERVGGGIGGFVGMSGWLPFRKQIERVFEQEGGGELRKEAVMRYLRDLLDFDEVEEEKGVGALKGGLEMPILLCHGEKDVKVKNQWGVEMRDVLTSMGMNVDFNSYPDLEHWFNDIEMRDVVTFLKSRWEGVDT